MTIEEDLLAKGEVIGQAKSLLLLLESRAIAISAAMRERVLSTRDESLLTRWFRRAVSMTTAEEVFEPLEASR